MRDRGVLPLSSRPYGKADPIPSRGADTGRLGCVWLTPSTAPNAARIANYWACKRAPGLVAEALQRHGGNFFIADNLMEGLYREATLNGIWQGTGNWEHSNFLTPGCHGTRYTTPQ